MEKIVSIPAKVEDLHGLLVDLKRSSFAVLNVGSDHNGTYVYLEEFEDKDPIPTVESWVGRPAPPPLTKESFESRLRTAKELEAIAAAKAATQPADALPAPSGADRRPSMLSRIFRKIF